MAAFLLYETRHMQLLTLKNPQIPTHVSKALYAPVAEPGLM